MENSGKINYGAIALTAVIVVGILWLLSSNNKKQQQSNDAFVRSFLSSANGRQSYVVANSDSPMASPSPTAVSATPENPNTGLFGLFSTL